MSNKQNSLTDFLLAFLSSARNSRRFYEILREQEIPEHKHRSVSVALSRMRKDGYAEHTVSGWMLTKKGRLRADNVDLMSFIISPFKKEKPNNNTIIAFDIPEIDRRMRDWLRNQLKIFGYKMLQQSLWRGPGPLPKSFLTRLDDLGIKENVKIFTTVRK